MLNVSASPVILYVDLLGHPTEIATGMMVMEWNRVEGSWSEPAHLSVVVSPSVVRLLFLLSWRSQRARSSLFPKVQYDTVNRSPDHVQKPQLARHLALTSRDLHAIHDDSGTLD